jgi:hypothetical protein
VRSVIATVAVLLSAAPLGHVVCTIRDDRLVEASGLGVGLRHPDTLYLHNDSGDSPRIFAVDRGTGATQAVLTLPSAENVVWEDMAVARDARGVPSLYVGDIGDNDEQRAEVRIYRVDEPSTLATGDTGSPDQWRLRYPGRPANAEGLAVAPGGRAYVVTKTFSGRSEVYAVPRRPDPSRVQVLRRVGTVHAEPTSLGGRLVTGAAFSADGTVFAARTYGDAYLWRVGAGGLAAALRTPPVRITLPLQPQGEAIAVDGTELLLASEGAHSDVLSVPVPEAVRGSAPPSAASPTPAAPSSSAPESIEVRHGVSRGVWAVIATVGVAATLVVLVLRRRRARR